MQARDIMTTFPIALESKTRIADAIEIMQENDIRHAPVLRGRTLVGILSDRDLRALWRPGSDMHGDGRIYDRKVEDFMSTDPVTVEAETDLDDVIALLIDHRIGAVPVLDAEGTMVGIVSTIDILRAAQGKL
ncbi:MAG: CBS domain-containing protein [Deltaproteobacteria bacterium]|jgi:acetoin utilization protein AcuB|nr:CBS domain-containing protein [Deltaproteobacteria bacterium]